MIVTRQRRKPFPWRRLLLPVIAVTLVLVALTWTPSRNVIVSGPAAPVWRAGGGAFDTVAKPFHFAAQAQSIAQKDKEIASLHAQLNDAQQSSQTKDKQIKDLQNQMQQLQAQAAEARSTPAKPQATHGTDLAGASMTAAGAGDLSANATADMHRTAQYWASMEPENAAKLVQRLPAEYVARIFALMSPDAAGSILDALPPAYAAQLTQEHPELRR